MYEKWYDETHNLITKRECDDISAELDKCPMISVCDSCLYIYETHYWNVLLNSIHSLVISIFLYSANNGSSAVFKKTFQLANRREFVLCCKNFNKTHKENHAR